MGEHRKTRDWENTGECRRTGKPENGRIEEHRRTRQQETGEWENAEEYRKIGEEMNRKTGNTGEQQLIEGDGDPN